MKITNSQALICSQKREVGLINLIWVAPKKAKSGSTLLLRCSVGPMHFCLSRSVYCPVVLFCFLMQCFWVKNHHWPLIISKNVCVVGTTVTSGSFFTNLFALALHIQMQSRTWRCLKKRKKPKTDPRCPLTLGVFDDNQGWIKVREWVEGLRLYLTLLTVPLPVQTEQGRGCLLSSACFGMHFPIQHETTYIISKEMLYPRKIQIGICQFTCYEQKYT